MSFKENHIATISDSITDLVGALEKLASNPPTVNVQPSSAVVVPPSKVDFSPTITTPEPAKRWVFEVTERDGIGRIKKLTATAL